MTGPSERAAVAAEEALAAKEPQGVYGDVAVVLAAAHDPALGEDASVNFRLVRDAVEGAVRREAREWDVTIETADALVEAVVEHLEREHREGRL